MSIDNLDENANAIASAIAAGIEIGGAEPFEMAAGSIYLVQQGDGTTEMYDLTGDEHREDGPRRKVGAVTLRDAQSFNAYWDKHKVDGVSEVFADLDTRSVVAVLDAHGGAGAPAGWRQHTATLLLRRTPEWEAWKKADRNMQYQQPFSEFIEDRLLDVVDPDGATMLEIAMSIEATIGVSFESSTRLTNGERHFRYKESIEGSAGRGGELAIPTDITIRVSPFQGAEPVDIKARFRYRIDRNTGALTLGVFLDNPHRVEEEAFALYLNAVEQHIGQPVLSGTAG